MRTVRRLYFYAVSLISLEIALWGAIGLARNIFNLVPGSTNPLASGLALVLAGLPIFLLHWNIAQRDAFRDDDEHASQVRALFLYGSLLGLLVPVVQSTLAVINRLLLSGFGLSAQQALVGSQQSYLDNLIALVANLVVSIYFFRILQQDWRAQLPGSSLPEVRRLYRYIWMLYGLIMAAAGARLILYFILYASSARVSLVASVLVNGLALVVVGTPLWTWTWRIIQNSLKEPAENRSILRLGILYLLSLSATATTLTVAGILLFEFLRRVLGASGGFRSFIPDQAGLFATLVPAGVIWAYFWRELRRNLASVPEESHRDGLRRIYFYLLSLGGTIATFSALQQLLSYLVQTFLGSTMLVEGLRNQLSGALAALMVGLPLWLLAWLPMQAEARRSDDAGDHARRSTIRKGYLYLVLFATVVGAMGSGGWLLYLIFRKLLGQQISGFNIDAANWFQTLALILVWLFYHLAVLRADGHLAQQSLGNRHADFSVLILQASSESFTTELVQALQRLAPRIPITVQRLDQGEPTDELLNKQVVVLPAWLAMQPGEKLGLWLSKFKGLRLLIPLPSQGWIWLGSVFRGERDLARETAQAVRQLAEGQEVRPSPPSNPWAVVGYVLGGIFGLILLIFAVGIVISSFR